MTPKKREESAQLVTVARIATAHGIRGEIAVQPLTDFPERLAPGAALLLVTANGEVSPRRVLSRRGHRERLLLLLEGVPDRTAAEGLRGGRLCVREEDLPPLPAGQVWRHELPGMAVATEAGEQLGTVREVLDTGGGNLVLALDTARGEVLLPFVEEVVRRVDRDARQLTVRLIDGFLP